MYEEKIAEVIEILQENSALWLKKKKKGLFFRKHKAKASGIRQKYLVIVVK